MKKRLLIAILFIFTYTNCVISQELTGQQLLEKAIQYHDPNANWETFNGTLNVTMETPKNEPRLSTIKINLPQEYFYVKATRDAKTTEYTVEKDSCVIAFNGKTNISEETANKNNLNCERANLYKNYYTYLYGLPMKLKDEGTMIDPKVTKKTFKGKEYLVLKVTYAETVGKDTWYFYFDPKTYAMEVYQFFKDESKNDGEYILLTEEAVINDIKMPKKRAWYYNKDDGYLGTDILGN
ncbi:hypothetical protein H2O64_06170 [Kordia sp. YSTF-M3]|uniref:Outer membrane lipoprotein-sorting protein n=1 Tax=Kordia aestuariivivens TaxID=2759037 RepID=A0ABR7Q6R4_9FLAO|nr:DUF6503 family protein [Kordia aestuariivivens]MBC8754250.1 hypothetical protein [Kordia aestuariivivens]